MLLDLRALTFMDSTGVRVLLEAAERGGGLRIVPPGGRRRARDDRRDRASAPLLPLVDGDAEQPR